MKPLSAIILAVTLFCLCQTANTLPPPAESEECRRSICSSRYSQSFPSNELTWNSWLQSYFYLITRLLADKVYQETSRIPQRMDDSLQQVLLFFVVPDYLALGLFKLGVLSDYEAVRGYIRAVFSILSIWLNWQAVSTPVIQAKPAGLVQFDSILLNSLFNMQITDTNQLLMTLKPWPVTPELQEGSSPLVQTLVDLHETLTTRKIHQCVLDSKIEEGSVLFACDQQGTTLRGKLELDNDCITFSWESVRPQHGACQFSKLQSSILDCFTRAIRYQTRINSDFIVSDCDATFAAQSLAQEGVEVLTLSDTEEAALHRDFLVAIHREKQTRHFVFTGAMATVQSSDSALQAMQASSYYWPAMGISWQDQLLPLSSGTELYFRMAWLILLQKLHDLTFQPLVDSRLWTKRALMHGRQHPERLAIEFTEADRTPQALQKSEVPGGKTGSDIASGASAISSEGASAAGNHPPETQIVTMAGEPESASTQPGMPTIAIESIDPEISSTSDSHSLHSIDKLPDESYMRRGSAPEGFVRQHLELTQPSLLDRRTSASNGQSLSHRKTLTSPLTAEPRRSSLPDHKSFKQVSRLVQVAHNFQGNNYSPLVHNRPDDILSHPKQGMNREHFSAVGKVTRLMALPASYRPINAENIELIPWGLPSKDLRIKPKTAEATFAKGFMPADQAFSKLAGNPAAIASARVMLADSITRLPDLITTRPLSLTDSRMRKLISQASECTTTLDPLQHNVLFEKNDIQWQQLARKNDDTGLWDIYMLDGRPFEVVAHPRLSYYIADYDPLIMAPPLSHHLILSTPPEYSVLITRTYARELDGTLLLSDSPIKLQALRKTPVFSLLVEAQFETSQNVDPVTGRTLDIYQETVLIPRKEYLQNQWFKPLDLGDYDRVQLPLVNPQGILDRLGPQITRFVENNLAGEDKQLSTALESVSTENARNFRSAILRLLLNRYHPKSGLLTTLVITPNKQLVELWVTKFPSALKQVPTGSYARKSTELAHLERVRSYLILVEGLPDYLKGMDPLLGNISPRMQQVIKMTNQAIDRGEGLGMVHHGCDSGNPYSGINDLCPITGLMPFPMGSYNKAVMISEPEGIRHLVKTLKSHGFHVPLNPNWQLDRDLRSSRFDWALKLMEIRFRGEAIPNGMMDADPVRYEIIIDPDPCLNDQDFQSCFKRVLPRYLYEYFIQESSAIRPSEVNGLIKVELNSNPASNIAN
ncbi:MAG: anthrax toxin-like adenylyl cyclase domain-containing protein [Endozoicomonas sp.]